MSVMSGIGKLFSPNDPELVEKTLVRINEQDTWNDVFSTKLIELLDNIDLLKREVREKMRSVESATGTAMSSLERAEIGNKQAAAASLEAQRLLSDATRQSKWARDLANEAEQRLRAAEARIASLELDLKNAKDRETNAGLKQLQAAKRYRVTMHYSAAATAVSWVAMIWFAWFALRPAWSLWAATAASLFLLFLAIFIPGRLKHDA